MKKIILILLMVAAGWSAAAQFREVPLLREGERQIGLNVGTSYGYHQWLAFRPQAPQGSAATISCSADSMVRNNLGYQVGFFWGHETQHDRFLETGVYFEAYYSVNPFHSKVAFTLNGQEKNVDVSYLLQRVMVHGMGFLSHRINDEFSVSVGMGLYVAPSFNSKLKLNGVEQTIADRDKGEALLGNILSSFGVDLNAGMKYWFSDTWFAGAKLQYNITSLGLLKLFGKLELEEGEDYHTLPIGSVLYDVDSGTAQPSALVPRNNMQLVLSIGHTW